MPSSRGSSQPRTGPKFPALPADFLPSEPPGEIQVLSLYQEDPLEKGMATHCSILAWRIPWTGEPGRLQSIGSQRVRHN